MRYFWIIFVVKSTLDYNDVSFVDINLSLSRRDRHCLRPSIHSIDRDLPQSSFKYLTMSKDVLESYGSLKISAGMFELLEVEFKSASECLLKEAVIAETFNSAFVIFPF